MRPRAAEAISKRASLCDGLYGTTRIRFSVDSDSVLGSAKYECRCTDERDSPIVCSIEPNTRAGNRFYGRNQFCADRSDPLRIAPAAAASITARDAEGLFSQTRYCDIHPWCVVRQTASDPRPRFLSPAVRTYRRDYLDFN